MKFFQLLRPCVGNADDADKSLMALIFLITPALAGGARVGGHQSNQRHQRSKTVRPEPAAVY
jgi:hypothetical protein